MATGMDELVARLEQVTADVEDHLERRARELAEPHIRKAIEDARVLVEAAQDRQQRAEDLSAELRRQVLAQEHRAQRAEHLTGVRHRDGFCLECTLSPSPERTTT